jgi:deoxyribodipyrimidine photo-lyase
MTSKQTTLPFTTSTSSSSSSKVESAAPRNLSAQFNDPLASSNLFSSLSYTYATGAETKVHKDRIRVLKKASPSSSGTETAKGPVIYWMNRDQRISDNWALLYAQEQALASKSPLLVLFCVKRKPDENLRQASFMFKSLQQLEKDLADLSIGFSIVIGGGSTVAKLANKLNASLLVTDFSPLRGPLLQQRLAIESLSSTCALHEVDAHNIVPAWKASNKLEVGARTIRSKLHALIPFYCTMFPAVLKHPHSFDYSVLTSELESSSSSGIGVKRSRPEGAEAEPPAKRNDQSSSSSSSSSASADVDDAIDNNDSIVPRTSLGTLTDWNAFASHHVIIDNSVTPVTWATPGERAAKEQLMNFLAHRLKVYKEDRNDPTKPKAQSNLSPWIHFGQISAQRIILELQSAEGFKSVSALFPAERTKSSHDFAEELVVRREVAENFCLYQPLYDVIEGASGWSQESLSLHSTDKRDYVYSRAQFEAGRTHEDFWNACQKELVSRGKLHGWARMYWAKKILEWSASPQDALATAIYLNDKFNLDGRDPSGFVGCMWSIAGVHDIGWAERPIFGKIRYMNLAGAKRKFNVPDYIAGRIQK